MCSRKNSSGKVAAPTPTQRRAMTSRHNIPNHPEYALIGARLTITRAVRIGACGLAAMIALAACDQPAVPPTAAPPGAGHPAFNMNASGGSAAADRDLAALRALTAPFHDIKTAEAAGWNVQLTGCMENPPAGGMGYHYANTAYIDGTAEVTKPQLLLYEPEKNGSMRLVAVEYVIPYSFVPATAPAPMLFGQKFHQNSAFQLWGLHAWVWEHNPSGMFADWNPNVSCTYAN
jgi:hypothetical protein